MNKFQTASSFLFRSTINKKVYMVICHPHYALPYRESRKGLVHTYRPFTKSNYYYCGIIGSTRDAAETATKIAALERRFLGWKYSKSPKFLRFGVIVSVNGT